MARDFNDYDDLLKNFDDYTSKNTSRDISSSSSSFKERDSKPDIARKEFAQGDFKPTPIRSNSSGNDMYFNRNQEPPTPKRKQNPNSPFYRDPEKDLPTPKSSDRGNAAFKSAKGILPKSKADAYLDDLELVNISDIKMIDSQTSFLLCTDGWWEYVSDEEMEDTLKYSSTAAGVMIIVLDAKPSPSTARAI